MVSSLSLKTASYLLNPFFPKKICPFTPIKPPYCSPRGLGSGARFREAFSKLQFLKKQP